MWIQRELTISTNGSGFYPLRRRIEKGVSELSQVEIGLLHLFLRHTSASLTTNENADRDVLTDLETGLERLAPMGGEWRHTLEGGDDMPAHLKSSLLGVSVTIPVRRGSLALGTWQEIYLAEHRKAPCARNLILTLHGE